MALKSDSAGSIHLRIAMIAKTLFLDDEHSLRDAAALSERGFEPRKFENHLAQYIQRAEDALRF